MKRGPKGSPVCDSLQALLKTACPKGFFPWVVTVSDRSCYCYARTKIDALRKTLPRLAVVQPCSVEEIIKASNSGEP